MTEAEKKRRIDKCLEENEWLKEASDRMFANVDWEAARRWIWSLTPPQPKNSDEEQ